MEILNEKEFNKKLEKIYQEEKINILNEKWDKLSKEDKLVIIEMFKLLNPNLRVPINEAKWYNTVMDWAGLIPGIGSAVDLVNGFSYWRQGDKLFAILSWIGALPIFGDLIAAPVITALKVGGRSAEVFKTAVLAKDAVKVAEAAKNMGGPVAKMVEQSPKWGTKLIEVLEKSVGRFPKLGKGLVETVKTWIDVFVNASKGTNAFTTLGKSATRKLTQDTKFYLGLLDWLGMGNFSGPPEELAKKVPDLAKKISEFEASDEGKKLTSSQVDVPSPSIPEPQQIKQPTLPSSKTDDPIGMLTSLLM
jgi:hypothetical protein